MTRSLIHSIISDRDVKYALFAIFSLFLIIQLIEHNKRAICYLFSFCRLRSQQKNDDQEERGELDNSCEKGWQNIFKIQFQRKRLQQPMNDKYKDITVSKSTKQKVEAAKNFIEQRYSKMIHLQQQKRQYWEQLNQKMQAIGMTNIEQQELKKQIAHQEAQQLRQDRKKIAIYDFKSVNIIGKGAFGEVRLCKWSKSAQPVAVKKLKKSQMIFKNKVMQSREERNVLAISEKNPWVVGLKCSFQDSQNLYLVMEYLPGGDLMNLLMKKDIFSHQEAQFYTAQILLALDSVHKMKYIHRDLKPDNVLLDASGHIKLSDFGLCKHTEIKQKRPLDNLVRKDEQAQRLEMTKNDFGKDFHKRNRKLAYSAVGTPDYVAPEVQGKLGYTQTVDWWSMGVILFEMLVGYPPFASETPRQTWYKIQNWRKYLVIPHDAKVSIQAADLIRKLVADPKDRLGVNGVEQIKAHPFFTGVNWQKLREKKSPYIPEVKNSWDTQNFDHYDEEQPWYPSEQKLQKGKKKNPQFIGYTYKPMQQPNSALIKALVDLDSYKIPQIKSNGLDYLQLQKSNQSSTNDTRFKKAADKTQRMNKQIYMTTTVAMTAKRSEQKQKQRYKFLYGDTPEKKPSPSQRFVKKSPKQSIKLSPSSKIWQDKKMKMKVVQKKLI